jgi:hypothetical protein
MPSQQINKHNYLKDDNAYIELSQGHYAIIDRDMLPLVMQHTWSVSTKDGYQWAQTSFRQQGVKQTLKLHHLIMGKPLKGYCVDHINGNALDNRRANLRSCTRQENTYNQTKVRGEVGYRGITKVGSRYRAMISHQGKRISLGSFATAKEAAEAYNQAASTYRGEYAALNTFASA